MIKEKTLMLSENVFKGASHCLLAEKGQKYTKL